MSELNNENSIHDMYEELLNMENSNDDNDINELLKFTENKRFIEKSDDCEDFLTSEDIVKTKEKMIEKKSSGSPSMNDGVIEESVHFKRYNKRHKHKYTEAEMNRIRESCKNTIVHDYGEFDIYHISDEERKRNDQLSEISLKLAKLKRTYRRVDQYIEAMRVVFEAWSILEKNNYIHTREEFYELISKGRIISNRIIMPKLKKMDNYNMDVIINYISNPELDASHLIPNKQEDPYDSFFNDDESEEDEMKRLLSKEEVEYIMSSMDSPEKMEIGYVKDKLIKGYDKRNYLNNKKKKFSKKELFIKRNLDEMLNKIQNGNHYHDYGFSYMVTNSLFEPEKKEKDIWDKLQFNGSWSNKNDVTMYELMVNEELMKERFPGNEYLTYADKNLQKFFEILENNGVNVIDLRRKIDTIDETEKQRIIKSSKKKNKKIESAIIQRITKLNNDPKFKKIVEKAENALNKYREGE